MPRGSKLAMFEPRVRLGVGQFIHIRAINVGVDGFKQRRAAGMEALLFNVQALHFQLNF